jgi:dipeptidase E
MQQSGFAELLPSLRADAVYVGLSAGSMVLTPDIGSEFVNWEHPSGTSETLGLVDFSIFPHLDHPDLPDNILSTATKWAAALRNPAYAIDDATAIQVVDGAFEIISEGQWHYFPRED